LIGIVEVVVLIAAASVLQLVFTTFIPAALLLDPSLVVVLYLGWRTGPMRGAVCGTVCGLLQDLTMLSPYVGLNGISKTIAGFVAGYLSKWVRLESPLGRVLVIMLFSVFDLAAVGLFMVVLGVGSFPSNWQFIVLRAITTGLIGTLFFRAYDSVKFPDKDFGYL